MIVLVMGVCGSGKSTIGRLLADALGARFVEGDDFHSPENVAKMQRGEPLDDDDRAEWLKALADELAVAARSGEAVVLACSALKHRYRQLLRERCPTLRVVCLHGPASVIAARLEARPGHFMPPSLLQSQLGALELPSDALIVDVQESPGAIARLVLERLRRDDA